MQAKGKRIKKQTSSRSKEVNNMVDKLYKMVSGVYPQTTGVDAAWHRAEGISYFGSKQKSDPYRDGSPRYVATEL